MNADTGSIPARTPWLVPLAQEQGRGALPEEGSRVSGAAEERVDGETHKKEEGKAAGIAAQQANKGTAVFNIADLHMPRTWLSTAVDTHREMVVTKHQKSILTCFFPLKNEQKW